MIGSVHRNQGSDDAISVVLTHPFASDSDPKTVADDVHLFRICEVQDCADEATEQRDRSGRRMCDAGTVRWILQQIALISLIPESPHIPKAEAMVHKKLCEVVNVAKRVAGGGERGVVIAVQKDD